MSLWLVVFSSHILFLSGSTSDHSSCQVLAVQKSEQFGH